MLSITRAGLLIILYGLWAADESIDDSTFNCIRDMTPVRGFFVGNLQGDIEATVAVSNAGTGKYPEGSVIQLVPTEVMVKREPGFSPATQDWEFIELEVSDKGSKILKRGTVDVVNQFGGNCFACHVKANPGQSRARSGLRAGQRLRPDPVDADHDKGHPEYGSALRARGTAARTNRGSETVTGGAREALSSLLHRRQ